MSKVTARDHQSHLVVGTDYLELLLVERIRQEWFVPTATQHRVAQVLVHLALLNWEKLKPELQKDCDYMNTEGFDSILPIHRAKIANLAKRGFKP